jgi:hypothetical protein
MLQPSTPALESFSSHRHRWWSLAIVMALAAYALLLWPRMGAYAGGSDSSGYLNQARLLEKGEIVIPQRFPAEAPPAAGAGHLYVPLGFHPAPGEEARMVPLYPVGLSLLTLGMARLTGWEVAPAAVMILHLLGGLGVVYLFGRSCQLTRPMATLAIAAIAASPLFVFMGLQLMSDVPSLAWVTLAILLAQESRNRSWLWASWCGFAVGMAVLLRPTNALVLFPVAVALGADPKRCAALIAGGLPAAVFLGWYNLTAYGAVFTTGYGNISGAFKLQLIGPTILHYLKWLPLLFSPLIALVLLLPWARAVPPRHRLLLTLTPALFLGFYSFYDHTHETWWYLRFVLPAIPAAVVGALMVAQCAWDRSGRWATRYGAVAFSASIILIAIFGYSWNQRLHAHRVADQEVVYPQVAGWAAQNLPAGTAVLAMQASGALFYYTDFPIIRWEHAPTEVAKIIQAQLAATDRPMAAVLFEFETESALAAWQPERWQKVVEFGPVAVWQPVADLAGAD